LIDLHSVADVANAIQDMAVPGAGLIGATAGYGMALAESLIKTRPTAVNLNWTVQRQPTSIRSSDFDDRAVIARVGAEMIADEDASACQSIDQHGLRLIQTMAAKNQDKS